MGTFLPPLACILDFQVLLKLIRFKNSMRKIVVSGYCTAHDKFDVHGILCMQMKGKHFAQRVQSLKRCVMSVQHEIFLENSVGQSIFQ